MLMIKEHHLRTLQEKEKILLDIQSLGVNAGSSPARPDPILGMTHLAPNIPQTARRGYCGFVQRSDQAARRKPRVTTVRNLRAARRVDPKP